MRTSSDPPLGKRKIVRGEVGEKMKKKKEEEEAEIDKLVNVILDLVAPYIIFLSPSQSHS